MDNCPDNNNKISLAIETSGRIGSVAVGRGDTLLGESTFSGFMKHSIELFPHIQQLLDQNNACPADIHQLFITVGPGSFTGLRIAVTVAKMLHFAHKTNIVAVDSMSVLAENATDYNNQADHPVKYVATILDAKRNLFYASVFKRNNLDWQPILKTQLIGSEELINWLDKSNINPVAFLGEGLVYYTDKFKAPFSSILDDQYWPATAGGLFRAGYKLAQAGHFADPVTLSPLYIRRPEAVENWEKRQQNV